ncbi:MAG TPA: hypothetical protein VFF04_02175 [Candidatus Babeliales bacterium]|nr:hypothetical protein [Candidatus Babeliales bacterium]
MKINIKGFFIIILGFLVSTSFNFGAESIFRPATRIIPGHEGRPNAEDYLVGTFFIAGLATVLYIENKRSAKKEKKLKKTMKHNQWIKNTRNTNSGSQEEMISAFNQAYENAQMNRLTAGFLRSNL